jgi:hypothetical protein
MTVDAWVRRWLESRANAYHAEAAAMEVAKPGAVIKPGPFTALQRRAIGDELRQLAIDLEKGPRDDRAAE